MSNGNGRINLKNKIYVSKFSHNCLFTINSQLHDYRSGERRNFNVDFFLAYIKIISTFVSKKSNTFSIPTAARNKFVPSPQKRIPLGILNNEIGNP